MPQAAPAGALASPHRRVSRGGGGAGLLYQAYFEPTPRSDGPSLPGSSEWLEGSVLHAHSGYELLELVTAIAQAEAACVHANLGRGTSPMARAKVVLRELQATLGFLFDDAEYTADDERLHKIWTTYGRPWSQHQMASALEVYSHFAEEHRARLAKLKAFDLGLLEEALVLSAKLRSRSAELHLAKQVSGASDFLKERNQLLALLRDRVGRIRRTAQLVFSAHQCPSAAQLPRGRMPGESRPPSGRRLGASRKSCSTFPDETRSRLALPD